MKYYPFKENRNLCVCHDIEVYLERTGIIRVEETQLLVSFIKPHKLVSTSKVSR